MNVRYSYHLDQGSSPTSGCTVRQVVIYDKQANGVAPTPTAVFNTDDHNSPLNLDNRDRFIVLSDVITSPITLGGSYATSGTYNRKFNLETIFNNNGAGDITDINTGSIYLFVAQSNAAFGVTLGQSTRIRLRFLDY